MKKIYSIIIFSSLCFIFSASRIFSFSNRIQTNINSYEAENASYDSLQLMEDESASGGKFLRMTESGNVKWNIKADTSGWYNLDIRYRAPEGEKEEYIIRNGYRFAVGFGMSEDWNVLSTPTFLHKGENDIELEKSWGNLDIDCLQIEPAKVAPTIKPVQNILYKEYPRDISFKINRFGYELKSVTCNGKNIPFKITPYPFYEDAADVIIPAETISTFNDDDNTINFNFSNGYSLNADLKVLEKRKPAELTIIAPYVEHGSSVLFILPAGKTLLVDCGKNWVRDEILIPFLHMNNITKINYFIITHYHEDHDSGDKGEKIKKLFHVDKFWDYQSFKTGADFNLEGTKIKILNTFADGGEENTRSMSFKLEYKGFVYVHGADNYAINQQKIMKRFPDDIRADVFYGNHHFHGSVDVDYLRAVDPIIVLLQSQQAIYARSAYMVDFLHKTAGFLKKHKKRFIEDLPALEVGTTVIRVNGKDDWTYETYKNKLNKIPYLNLEDNNE